VPLTALHHVQVACPAGSEDAFRAFYGGVLGRSEAAGHPVQWDPEFPGHRRLYVSDPIGDRLELLEPLSAG
jgi:hypothetical protein